MIYFVVIKSLTGLFWFTEISILYLNDTSASVASIIRSKYPSLFGAIIPLLILSLPLNIGVMTALVVLFSRMSLLFTIHTGWFVCTCYVFGVCIFYEEKT